MQPILDWLKGKKSYILMVAAFVFNLGVLSGWWTLESSIWQTIDAILGLLLGTSFRAAITKSGPQA